MSSSSKYKIQDLLYNVWKNMGIQIWNLVKPRVYKEMINERILVGVLSQYDQALTFIY